MSSNICGNCQNFKPKKGDKFFDCTTARHAGVKYGMQVRANTRSCDAFLPFGTPRKPAPSTRPTLQAKPKPKPEPKPSVEDRPRPTGLCVWGKVILITALLLVIGLPAWGIYSCAYKSTSEPLSTPVPIHANAIVIPFGVGENIWATGPDRTVRVSSTERMSSYTISSSETFNAPSGKVFIFITVTCKNIGNTSFWTGPSYFWLTDSAGHLYKDQTYGDYRFSEPYQNTSLSPSVTITGNILWIVPVSASVMEVSYLLDSGSNPPVIARWEQPQ